MSIEMVLSARDKDLGGGFRVRRLLPAAERQSIGPFLFFDHFGPVEVEPGVNHDVRPHPHIGLATVTYLFEGAIMHRDSLGFSHRIEPGAINWMTAGRGIVHSERGPEDLRTRSYTNHGLQLWAALPLAFEETEPSFSHTPASAIPVARFDGAEIRVLIGSAFGQKSPVATFSETVYLDIQLEAGAAIEVPALAPELGVYVVAGEVLIDGHAGFRHTLSILQSQAASQISCKSASRFVVIGGKGLDAERFIWWNFVSSQKARITQASADWEMQRMAHVAGDPEFIPLPAHRFIAS
jgi:redox-sensitive bicupin YhaK (pirin superfamily)